MLYFVSSPFFFQRPFLCKFFQLDFVSMPRLWGVPTLSWFLGVAHLDNVENTYCGMTVDGEGLCLVLRHKVPGFGVAL